MAIPAETACWFRNLHGRVCLQKNATGLRRAHTFSTNNQITNPTSTHTPAANLNTCTLKKFKQTLPCTVITANNTQQHGDAFSAVVLSLPCACTDACVPKHCTVHLVKYEPIFSLPAPLINVMFCPNMTMLMLSNDDVIHLALRRQ